MRILLLTIACLCLMEAYAEGKKEKRNRLPFPPRHKLFLRMGVYPFLVDEMCISWNDSWVYFVSHRGVVSAGMKDRFIENRQKR